MKNAILSLDIEDWYHLDYFSGKTFDRSYSMLDGLEVYRRIIEHHNVPSSFFVLGEITQPLKTVLSELCEAGHDVGSHGRSHIRPLTMDVQKFESEVKSCKQELEDILGKPVIGYRAPCFSLDRERLDILRNVGYKFDSSRIRFGDHPLYGDLNMDGFQENYPAIYRSDEFFEFEVSTLPLVGKRIPVSGGGYLRIFPWVVMKRLLECYLKKNSLFTLYIHPFELSSCSNPDFPVGLLCPTKCALLLGDPL